MARLDESTPIVQLKVRLLGISPMIWRRVLVPSSVTLRELHGILQASMGWEGIHLYYFDIHAVHYGSFELSAENPDIALSCFRFRERGRFPYLYDMGDYWEHEVRIGEIPGPESEENLPRLHRWLWSLPARGLRRRFGIPGVAGRSDGLGCVVGPGPRHRICGRYPGGTQCWEADRRRPGGHRRRP